MAPYNMSEENATTAVAFIHQGQEEDDCRLSIQSFPPIIPSLLCGKSTFLLICFTLSTLTILSSLTEHVACKIQKEIDHD